MTDSHSDSETQTEDTNPSNHLPSSYSQQQTEIRRIVDTTELKEGDSWFLIDARWFKQWKRYVGFDTWDQSDAGRDSTNPGPIDNKQLFKGTRHTVRIGKLTYRKLSQMELCIMPY
jgi:ubiquitin carboxyl-terminal hydrolase 4/11/15